LESLTGEERELYLQRLHSILELMEEYLKPIFPLLSNPEVRYQVALSSENLGGACPFLTPSTSRATSEGAGTSACVRPGAGGCPNVSAQSLMGWHWGTGNEGVVTDWGH
jgi:hypothetical protein